MQQFKTDSALKKPPALNKQGTLDLLRKFLHKIKAKQICQPASQTTN